MSSSAAFGIIGSGWRAEFFLRVAQACPDLFRVVGVTTRSADKARSLAARFDVPVFSSADELLKTTRPKFVVTSVPRAVNVEMIGKAAAAGIPVLSETPPAADIEGMEGLCELVAKGARIQVAEQYHLQPHHAARIAFARSGKLGKINQAQVSVAHGYHGISLIRRFLGVRFENARITGREVKSKMIQGPGRDGPPTAERLIDAAQVIITYDFGDRLGILDFMGSQYFSPVRGQRLLVLGERGEIINRRATYLKDYLTAVRVSFDRHEAGPEGNLEGLYLKGIQAGEEWVYENPLVPARLTDDEIAVGSCLLRMSEYLETGQPFYSLAEACQDTYLDLMGRKAIETGGPVETSSQSWGRIDK